MNSKGYFPIIGAHMSISNGLKNAILDGISIGCTAIQIFTHSNRQWEFKPIETQRAHDFIDEQKKSGMNIIVHASYLINLASENPETVEKSFIALKQELEACRSLNIKNLVLHPGSGSNDKQDSIKKLINQIKKIRNETNFDTNILIEIMAGQGKSIGSNLEEIGTIINAFDEQEKIGFCLDTCHAWASGYNLSEKHHYEKFILDIDQKIGLEKLKTIHLNDSEKELSSKVDRHAGIGLGKIGLKCFEFIMNDERLNLIPKILETPKESLKDDKINLDKLRDLIY